MFLTVHGAVGILIGQHVKNPLLAFVIGFLTHYLFDIIPHGDTKAPAKWKQVKYMALAASIDMLVLIFTLLWLYTRIEIINLSIAAALLGSVLPDFLQAFYFLSNRKLFKLCQKVHDFFHEYISNKYEWNLYAGFLFQLIVLALMIFLIF
jgi:hypothetical protein